MSVPLTYLAGLILLWGSWILVNRQLFIRPTIRHATLIILINVSLISLLLVIGETYLRWKGLERT
jgi:hypothetical protein